MQKTNRERVLDYLRSIAPERATNSQIRDATHISPHQQVFQITQALSGTGLIRAEHAEKEWFFWVDAISESPVSGALGASARVTQPGTSGLSAAAFEELAREVLSRHLGVRLTPGTLPGVHKQWDMVAPDRTAVGDAKYFTLVGGSRLPPAKFSVIAEHVWLLQSTGASVKFLVFGNDRRVPEQWLRRYGSLVSDVEFFFLTDEGVLEELRPPSS